MRLGRVVNAILVDLASAQHNANEYAKLLSQKYKPDPENPNALAAFRVPGGALNDIEFDLKFAVRELQEVEGQTEATLNKTVLNNLVEGYVRKAIAKLRTAIEQNMPLDQRTAAQDLRDDNAWETVVRNLRSKSFEQHLCDVITDGIKKHREAIVEEISSLHTAKVLEEAARKSLTDHLENRDDLTQILATQTPSQQTIQDVFEADLPQFLGETSPDQLIHKPKPELTPSVDVILNPDDLKDAPVETLSSIRLKASLNNYRWTITDTSEVLNEV